MHKKFAFPQKLCPVCNRPFSWRKKWERHWESVRYCSQKCRRTKNRIRVSENPSVSTNTTKL
ncbi:DUF2256 domain-containing protein [Robiginitalea sp.]|uniref:DUF2256 domain-containing protein n=1 Tax=Robiginitalea sp. TaxID=1902411 RepID=UPI003C72072F